MIVVFSNLIIRRRKQFSFIFSMFLSFTNRNFIVGEVERLFSGCPSFLLIQLKSIAIYNQKKKKKREKLYRFVSQERKRSTSSDALSSDLQGFYVK
jgi:hypothetical protein